MTHDVTREAVAARLRKRILRGLGSGTLAPGHRLPSAREAGAEFDADHRVVLAAYRQLATEGLVELRERTGIYVARSSPALLRTPGVDWLVDVFVEGLTREVPIVELEGWIHRAIGTRRLRAVVVEGTRDQVAAMSRELREDYGFDVAGIHPSELASPTVEQGAVIDGADLLLTTKEFARQVRSAGKRAGLPVIVAEVGPDLLGGDWRALLHEPLYLIVSDESSIAAAERNFATVPEAASNLRIMLVGRDDVASIPADAAVYISRGAAEVLGDAPVGGRPVPRARVFSWKSAREIIEVIVRANLSAYAQSKVSGAPARRGG